MDEEDKSKINDEEEVLDDQSQEDDSQEDLQDESQEESQDEQQEEDEQGDQEEEVEELEPEEKKPSRREQLRINDLLKKYGNPEERQNPSTDENGINFRDIVDADDDTLDQLDKTSKAYGDKRHSEGLARAEFLNWNTSLKIDTPIVFANHPQMNDERVSASVNAEYLNFVGYNEKSGTVARPDVSYADFVDARMEQAQAIAEAMTEKTRRTVTRQASRTAIRPNGSSPKPTVNFNKPIDKMTDAELDAYGKSIGL